jgi:hypothetical protein
MCSVWCYMLVWVLFNLISKNLTYSLLLHYIFSIFYFFLSGGIVEKMATEVQMPPLTKFFKLFGSVISLSTAYTIENLPKCYCHAAKAPNWTHRTHAQTHPSAWKQLRKSWGKTLEKWRARLKKMTFGDGVRTSSLATGSANVYVIS